MKLHELSAKALRRRLKGPGVTLQMGPFIFRFNSRVDLTAAFQTLYAHYDLLPDDPADFLIDYHLTIIRQWQWPWLAPKANVLLNRVDRFERFDRQISVPILEWAVNWCTFTRPNHLLMLHAAVVERKGLAVVLPGKPGAGKSTLCAAMSLRGWRLLSDELAVMQPPMPGEPPSQDPAPAPNTDLIPVPRPIGLKNESIEVIRRFESTAVLGPSFPGTHKGTVAHLQTPLDAIEHAQKRPRPRWIIFPSYTRQAPTTLAPYSKAQTLLRLAEDAFNFSLLGATAFDHVAALVDESDCYELTYSDLEDAVQTLDQLLDAVEPPPATSPAGPTPATELRSLSAESCS